MEKFTIIKKSSPVYRFAGIIFGFILLVSYLISVFYKVQKESYDFLFYSYLFLALISLCIILRYAFFVGDKEIFSMDSESILSKIPKSSFSINWANVSRIEIDDKAITFLLNAEKQRKQIQLNALNYVDASELMKVAKTIAQSKNITINIPTLSETEVVDKVSE